MTVLIDEPIWWFRDRRWSHLVSDVSLDELHDFAGRVGIPERGFHGDHYDVPEEYYAELVAAGAEPTRGRELVRRLKAAGLRRERSPAGALAEQLAREPDPVGRDDEPFEQGESVRFDQRTGLQPSIDVAGQETAVGSDGGDEHR
jgi:hypothetical protein